MGTRDKHGVRRRVEELDDVAMAGGLNDSRGRIKEWHEEVDATPRRGCFAGGHHSKTPGVAHRGCKIRSADTAAHGGQLHGMIAANELGESCCQCFLLHCRDNPGDDSLVRLAEASKRREWADRRRLAGQACEQS